MKKIILSAVVASSLLMAADVDTTKESAFLTHTEFGYIQTDGNTETKTYNLEAKVTKNWQKHVFGLVFDGQYADDKGVETKNKYFTELEYDYEITDRFAFDYLVGYKDDKFSSFDYQFYTGPGAKYKAIVSEKHNLNVEGNILYAMDSYLDVYSIAGETVAYPNSTAGADLDTPAYDDDYTAYRLKGVYNWQVLENLKFEQELSYRGSFEDAEKYFIFSKTALSSKISDIFSAGLSYKVDYVNEPAADKDQKDTTITANIIIDY
ncbi:MAG: DUF481 domain-containing protein [Campylobacterota bacterium]|nr:DUF481 domain-containing protein [Campylobacterota bacterium]